MKNQFLAWVGTAVLGMTGIGIYFRKNISKILKAIKVSRDILDIIDESVQSTQDSKLTSDEIQKIADLVNKLKTDIKGA